MACCMMSTGSFSVTNISDVSSAINSQTQKYEQLQQKANDELGVIREQLCNWAQPEYGDAGESWEKTFWKSALIAVATLNTVAQTKIREKQYKIAKDYANMATDKWNRFKDAYAPLERSMLNEAGNTKEPTPDYDDAKERGQLNNSTAFASANSQMSDLAKKYALCVDDSLLNDMLYAEAIVRDDGVNFDYRDEEYFALVMSDVRWNRRSALLNLGRNIQAQSATYASAANNMLSTVGNTIEAGAQGAMKLFGYLSTAQDTQYPTQFSAASPLMGQASSFASNVSVGPI